jgi:alpha-glucosidase
MAVLALTCSTAFAKAPDMVASPDGTLSVSMALDDGVPYWGIQLEDESLLDLGRLGIEVEGKELGRLKTVSANQVQHRELVKTTWGKFSSYDDHYNELTWTLRERRGDHRTIRVVIRVYDQGVGLRYEFPADGSWDDEIALTVGLTEFRFTQNGTGWCYDRERDPIGPEPLSYFHDNKGANLPFTVECGEDVYLGVLEAAIFEQAKFRLFPQSGSKTAFRESFSRSVLSPGSTTSWRVVLVGRDPGVLLTSPVMYCLNPPRAIDDPSWIEPGLAFWDWRAWGATTDDGFTYGLDMASWRRFIDYASENNVRYLVLDANWYGPEFEADSDPRVSRDHLVIQPDTTKPEIIREPAPADWSDPIDVPALIQYGNDRNVGVILYINDIARKNYPFEETLALYHEWGAAGIKYGFMAGKGQQKVLDTRSIVELCAKYELLCNFHDDPVPPSGDERTYPNYVSREFCHSQSDALRAFGPGGFCEQVFVNMLAGPLDMCNGLYTLKDPQRDRPRVFKNIDSTLVAETARVMIVYSGMPILPDTPEAYSERDDLFDFLRRLPMTWDETRILNASIGEYITTARRSGNEWFIASATDDQARTLSIPLDFLDAGKEYIVTLYEDAPDAHYKSNREAYRVREIEVKAGDTIQAPMVPGGGHCAYIRSR